MESRNLTLVFLSEARIEGRSDVAPIRCRVSGVGVVTGDRLG